MRVRDVFNKFGGTRLCWRGRQIHTGGRFGRLLHGLTHRSIRRTRRLVPRCGRWKVDAPITCLRASELHFDVALRLRENPHFHHATDCVLARFQVREHEHLPGRDNRCHPQNATFGKNNDRAGLLFKTLTLGIVRSRTRTVDLNRNFEGDCVCVCTRPAGFTGGIR